MKKYQTEFKLEVVKSFLTGEGGAKLLARRWSLPEEKIRSWVTFVPSPKHCEHTIIEIVHRAAWHLCGHR